ncbi:tripeptide aminopeptidase [Chryseomicrobium aureum]|uniref:M20/M25/M40 family metallo-hydrolase n=1 Tax=Chryseomicrobium aureum TaxID=1441723 RepID=UPI00195A5505|nr:M20/M25/M40 family metallo-hydrolase [Chryseomicrobium aureum]MBM7705677.1 tripeptide aminopeptidase [Chryseomicrobium aureum]
MTRLLEEFIELVEIPSETGNEQIIAPVLKTKLEDLGFTVLEDDAKEKTGFGAGNLIATKPGDAALPKLLFSVHMDTVTPGVDIKAVRGGDRIVSEGETILGADDKAGIAALFEALRRVNESEAHHGQLQVVITVGEESGLVGAKALDPSLLDADFGYALDSDGEVGGIVVAAPFQAKLWTTITGKPAHAGVAPEKGISAITVAAKSISAMNLGRIDEETTANIGRFEGGKATNIVCPEVHILSEARALTEEKVNAQVKHMVDTFETTATSLGASAETKTELMYPGFSFSEQDEVVSYAKHSFEALEIPVSIKRSGGGSDANVFNGLGIPTAILSVGYEEIHTTNESMPIAQLEKLADVVTHLIKR